LFNPGDVVVIDFPGVTGVKRRPTVVVSSPVYHAARPDIVVGLITRQTTALAVMKWSFTPLHENWSGAGRRSTLREPSASKVEEPWCREPVR
jgi:mRNA interferase MazF